LKTASDEDLMLAYAKGNAAAFDELFARHGQKVYNLFLRALGNAATASDLTQETFLRVVTARERYEPARTFSSWLYTIAMNLLRDQIRRRKRRGATEDLSAVDLELAHAAPDEAKAEELAAVQKAVQCLPAEQREVILLAKYQALSYAEIAKVLGIAETAAKQRAYRALKTLRAIMAPERIHSRGES